MVKYAALLIAIFAISLIEYSHGMGQCDVVRFVRSKGTPYVRTWTCIAYYESTYRETAMGGPNSYDGSYDHGLWQINDKYWCYNPSNPGLSYDCNINCADLRNNNLEDDWNCVKTVYARHGFSAWSVYPKCTNAENEAFWTNGC